MAAAASIPAKKVQFRKIIDSFLGAETTSLSNTPSVSVEEAYDAYIQLLPELYRRRKDSYSHNDLASTLHRPPVKKRLADARFKEGKRDRRFLYHVNVVDKFKDIQPALTLRYYWDCIVVESCITTPLLFQPSANALPGTSTSNSSVFPLSDPTIQECIDWIEDGKLHPLWTSLMHEHGLSIYFDGCIMVEIQDFRFRTIIPNVQRANTSSVHDEVTTIDKYATRSLHPAANAATNLHVAAPEIRRILLRPNEATMAKDIALIMDETFGANAWSDADYLKYEENLRLALNPSLNLDPNPKVGELLMFAHMQGNKMKRFRKDPYQRAMAVKDIEDQAKQSLEGRYSSTPKSTGTFGSPSSQFLPLSFNSRLLQAIQDIKNSKRYLASEPFIGLDSKKMTNMSTTNVPAKAIWNIPIQKIYRTVRLERNMQAVATTTAVMPDGKKLNSQPMIYSLNIVVSPDGLPEVIIRIGTVADTAIGGDTIRFKLASPYLIETYIASFKALVLIQDFNTKCTTDLTNPACFHLFNFTTALKRM